MIPVVAFALVIAGVVAVSVLTDETQDPLQAGDEASTFALPDGEGNMVDFGPLVEDNEAVALIFYRGFG